MPYAACLRTNRKRRKKKGRPYIIPPDFGQRKNVDPSKKEDDGEIKHVVTTSQEVQTPGISLETKTESTSLSHNTPEKNTTERKSLLKQRERGTSGLSLNSIRKKKEHEENKVEKVVDPSNLPTSAFTEEEMKTAWIAYGKSQDKKGERIIGSMFAMNIPTLEGTKIYLELPNESMKVDLESAKSGLLQFMYRKLDNYNITLHITVNEEASKKYAFTPQDKYEKLKEKNPLIDKLRASFDLDI